MARGESERVGGRKGEQEQVDTSRESLKTLRDGSFFMLLCFSGTPHAHAIARQAKNNHNEHARAKLGKAKSTAVIKQTGRRALNRSCWQRAASRTCAWATTDLGEEDEVLVVLEVVYGQHAGDLLVPRDRQHLNNENDETKWFVSKVSFHVLGRNQTASLLYGLPSHSHRV